MILALKLKGFKLNRRGISSIVGAIFMVLIIWIIASSYFFFTLSQNTTYNSAVREVNQEAIDRISESVRIISFNYTINANDNVTVSAKLQNTGPASVQSVTIWAYASNNTWANYNYVNFSLSIKGGETLAPFTVTVPVSGVKLGSSYDVTSWLITTRGNTISLPKQVAMTNNVLVAAVSEGIGSVAFDFEKFYHYEFSAQPSDGTPLPVVASHNYTLSIGKYNVLHVTVTNYDLLQERIVLDGNSSIFIVGEHSGTVKWDKWAIVKVDGGLIYPSSSVSATLEYGESIDLYFAATIAGIDTGSAYPLNILLYGTKGDNEYGQNIPFVSVYLTS